ncbi:MAG: alpha/beta fold hydrolase [Candidatus Thiodiazotropha sp.]
MTKIEVDHHRSHINGIHMCFVLAGPVDTPPIVLLHGWPETWYAWRKQILVLSEQYRLIVPDLHGYVETDMPSEGYDKRNMAKGYWFFNFNQLLDLPEELITGREEIWMRHWLSS